MPRQSHVAPVSERARAQEPHRSEEFRAGVQESLDIIAAAIVALGFFLRLWRAQATFFSTDEAWHFALANQNSLAAAYKASLTLLHPPLLLVILYYWRHLGTSNLVLRLPSVIAGTLLCWAVYRWLSGVFSQSVGWMGLLFTTFLPPLIALSAELRQYTLMMLFAVCSAYLLEEALATGSDGRMIGSCLCLYLAMVSHYSAFLFAAALGGYCIVRMIRDRPQGGVIAAWSAGQVIGIALGYFFYVTHISKLGGVNTGAQPIHNYADWYLSEWYFHPGRDHVLPFLYRGTIGIFRFTFGQTAVGQIATVLYILGVLLLVLQKPVARRWPPRSTAVLLLLPFLVNWAAVAAGLYPYGRTRQCVYLAWFAIAGVSAALAIISAGHMKVATLLALGMIIVCHARGTLEGRDMLPLAEQRQGNMDQAIQFIRKEVAPKDLILTDMATSFQLRHYLCDQMPVKIERNSRGYESFQCSGIRISSTGPDEGALTADAVDKQWVTYESGADSQLVWVVQGGWASGLGEELRRSCPAFAQTEVHSFGRYLEVFRLPPPTLTIP